MCVCEREKKAEMLLGKQLVSWKLKGNERDVFECKYVCKYIRAACMRSEICWRFERDDMRRGENRQQFHAERVQQNES